MERWLQRGTQCRPNQAAHSRSSPLGAAFPPGYGNCALKAAALGSSLAARMHWWAQPAKGAGQGEAGRETRAGRGVEAAAGGRRTAAGRGPPALCQRRSERAAEAGGVRSHPSAPQSPAAAAAASSASLFASSSSLCRSRSSSIRCSYSALASSFSSSVTSSPSMTSMRRWQMMTSCRIFTPSCSSKGLPATSIRLSSASRLRGSNSFAAAMRLPDTSRDCRLAISSHGPSSVSKLFFERFRAFRDGRARTPPRPGKAFSATLNVSSSGMSRSPVRQSRRRFRDRSKDCKRPCPRNSAQLTIWLPAKLARRNAGKCSLGSALSWLPLRSRYRRWQSADGDHASMDSIKLSARLSFSK
mmetsp:Transcript_69437/g.224560  ORF Transcript_69437/g.224560 Transcript_69437/m.224560 type:complete len:357 (+) Transcript_69437:472-1542(+)